VVVVQAMCELMVEIKLKDRVCTRVHLCWWVGACVVDGSNVCAHVSKTHACWIVNGCVVQHVRVQTGECSAALQHGRVCPNTAATGCNSRVRILALLCEPVEAIHELLLSVLKLGEVLQLCARRRVKMKRVDCVIKI
jgi:hypothetical protein